MIDASRLLEDLKRLRRGLDVDLRDAHAAGPGRDAVRAEWQAALEAGRTRETFETFFDASLDQAGVHWVLACVFLRFLEDNGLIDPPMIGGPQDRLELARERHAAYFRAHPHQSDLDWLLALFGQAAQLPGLAGLFDPTHNPLIRLPVSGDGAGLLRAFFQKVVPETGAPVHDFTDPIWDTRFLGDLYQDLSELARKRYALLQTPEFVESWILDRTLEPAIKEFGFQKVRMIDPACGSGHFLLGGFQRVLRDWQVHEPDMPPPALARRALDAVAGVDLNPFAVEVARFRLLLAALRAAGVSRLRDAPDFPMNLAVGDSLLHGRHFGRRELGGAAEGFGRVLHHVSEDTTEVDSILSRQYHVVVGNPPYITPKDPAMRDAYREIYTSCHMKYALAVPFIERFFDLAEWSDDSGEHAPAAGFVGLIVANSFMKREFGSKLIEDVLTRVDLTHVVDCSGAYIPGHGIPTAILFGRNRVPASRVVRTVRGIRGEPATPEDPAAGLVWSAILAQTDLSESLSEFISTEDTPRASLARHPWNMGGGGASEVQETIEDDRPLLGTKVFQIGFSAVTGADDVFAFGTTADVMRTTGTGGRLFVIGEDVRDHVINPNLASIWLYDADFKPVSLEAGTKVQQHMWPYRTVLSNRKLYGQPILEAGLQWHEYGEVNPVKQRIPLSITFAFVTTHNHFVLDRGGKVFNRSAPVIKLAIGASEDDHLRLLALLNSSIACFWMKQIFHNKGSTVDEKEARQRTEPFEDFYEITGTGLQKFPIATNSGLDIARALDAEAQCLAASLPGAVCARSVPTGNALDRAQETAEAAHATMIALQEELDWRCYRLYGLVKGETEYAVPPPLHLGERAFEIVMGRRTDAGILDTTWFIRHGSAPITDLTCPVAGRLPRHC